MWELQEADFRTGAKRVKSHGATYIPREQLQGVVSGRAAKRKARDMADAQDDADDGGDMVPMSDTRVCGACLTALLEPN